MVLHPESNFGWLFRQQIEEEFRCLVFASSDNPMVAWRPKLTIIYTSCNVPEAKFSTSIQQLAVTFHDTSVNATAWNWSFGDGTTSTDKNPDHTYSIPGSYKVCLTASDSCGSSMICQTIDVTCTLPTVQFTYYLIDQAVQFIDTSFSTYVLSRNWDFGDSTFSTAHNPTHNYSNGLYVYYVCFTATDSCGNGTICDSIYVEPPMSPHFNSTSSGTNDLLVDFTGLAEGAATWDWSFGDGEHSNLRNPAHLYPSYGDYKVCLTATNPLGVSSNCDSLKVVRKLSNNQNGVTVYPNPTSGSLKIKFNSDQSSIHIVVSNSLGSAIMESGMLSIKGDEEMLINLTQCLNGVYFLKISTDKMSSIEKVVKD
jgi:PKD repeat protein